MNVVIIIPARYGSSRYKGKPLVKILNREMILRVADICSHVVDIKNLYIATDSNKISQVVKRENYKVVMTSKKCLTGTDRVAEAALKINSEILEGIDKNKYNIFNDRKNGLEKAITKINRDDILVIFGKGRENYQDINGIKIKYSDIEIIEKYIWG